MSADAFLPYGRQTIEDDDIAAVAAVLRGDWLTTGPAVEAFERALAQRTGARHAVVCNSGTAALHLAMAALDIGPGDAVIVPAITFLASANAARYVGAEVVFADVDAATGLLRAEDVAAALKRVGALRPRAVLPVHLGGHIADLPAIAAAAPGLAVIEDACHALGGAYARGAAEVPVGACADSVAACFSFHPVKLIAMGEGGAVTTNDAALANRLARLRSHGMERDAGRWGDAELGFTDGAANPWYYEMPELGWNYRASDINCALGLSQLSKLDRFLQRRRQLAAAYDRHLEPLAPIVRPVPRPAGQQGGWHLYGVAIDFARAGVSRAELMRRLRATGIGTQVHYIPVHRQPYYRRRYGALALPDADAYYARCLSLPLYPAMTDADAARVAAALAAALHSA
ncbi:MAG: UDP-4-amino-4,6-dideoxy-N-acetyl-beta-L-altrosamine transaminase [Alphaproteobacteria bacterium]